METCEGCKHLDTFVADVGNRPRPWSFTIFGKTFSGEGSKPFEWARSGDIRIFHCYELPEGRTVRDVYELTEETDNKIMYPRACGRKKVQGAPLVKRNTDA